jgi:hypothetical protein
MKTFQVCLAVALVVGAFAQGARGDDQPIFSTYKSYLGESCERYDGSPKAELTVLGGALEAGISGWATALAYTSKAPKVVTTTLSVLTVDGLGRVIGGKCSGFTGLDDAALSVAGGAVDLSVETYRRAKAGAQNLSKAPNLSATQEKKVLSPTAVEEGAASFSGPGARSAN